jgi:hypothetical protein
VFHRRTTVHELWKVMGTSKFMIPVPHFDLKSLIDFATCRVGTSNRRHCSATKRPDNKPARQMVAYENGQGTLVVRCQHSHPFAAVTLRMSASKNHQQNYHSGGALDLTFAFDVASGRRRTSNPLHQP